MKKCHHKEWIANNTLRKVKDRKDKKAVVNSSRTRDEIKQKHENMRRQIGGQN